MILIFLFLVFSFLLLNRYFLRLTLTRVFPRNFFATDYNSEELAPFKTSQACFKFAAENDIYKNVYINIKK